MDKLVQLFENPIFTHVRILLVVLVVSFLSHIDKLVQLLESPIFTHVRILLLVVVVLYNIYSCEDSLRIIILFMTTLSFLLQIDKLVQLLESPIFTHVKIH